MLCPSLPPAQSAPAWLPRMLPHLTPDTRRGSALFLGPKTPPRLPARPRPVVHLGESRPNTPVTPVVGGGCIPEEPGVAGDAEGVVTARREMSGGLRWRRDPHFSQSRRWEEACQVSQEVALCGGSLVPLKAVTATWDDVPH